MREIGVVRFLLGDTPEQQEAAKAYIPVARTQLGVTKNLMRLGGLQSLARNVQLSDGTVIRCMSVMGQDTVGIVPPPRAVRPIVVKPVETKAETPRKKKRTPIYASEWWRGPDGPAKNGHRAMWDAPNDRLLVYSGWDRDEVVIPAMEAVPSYGAMIATGNLFLSNGTPISNPYAVVNFDYTGTGLINTDSTLEVIAGRDLNQYSGLGPAAGWVVTYGAQTTYDPHPQGGDVKWAPYYDAIYNAENPFASFVAYAETNTVYTTEVKAQTGGTARYASTSTDRWYDAAGALVGYTDQSGPVEQLYESADPAAEVDGFVVYPGASYYAYKPAPLAAVSGLFDLLLSNELWQWTLAGGWAQLAPISADAWDALVADSMDGEDISWRNQGAAADVGSVVGGYTYVWKYDNDVDWNTLWDIQFGGTTGSTYDGDDASGELWIYFYNRTVVGYVEEDDFT